MEYILENGRILLTYLIPNIHILHKDGLAADLPRAGCLVISECGGTLTTLQRGTHYKRAGRVVVWLVVPFTARGAVELTVT